MGAAEDVIPGLAAVQDIGMYVGPESGKELLNRNGFVVTRHYFPRIYHLYMNELQSHFITADSVHNTYHVIFADLLKAAETAMAEVVLRLTWAGKHDEYGEKMPVIHIRPCRPSFSD